MDRIGVLDVIYDMNIQTIKYCGVLTWNMHTNGVECVYVKHKHVEWDIVHEMFTNIPAIYIKALLADRLVGVLLK